MGSFTLLFPWLKLLSSSYAYILIIILNSMKLCKLFSFHLFNNLGGVHFHLLISDDMVDLCDVLVVTIEGLLLPLKTQLHDLFDLLLVVLQLQVSTAIIASLDAVVPRDLHLRHVGFIEIIMCNQHRELGAARKEFLMVRLPLLS